MGLNRVVVITELIGYQSEVEWNSHNEIEIIHFIWFKLTTTINTCDGFAA